MQNPSIVKEAPLNTVFPETPTAFWNVGLRMLIGFKTIGTSKFLGSMGRDHLLVPSGFNTPRTPEDIERISTPVGIGVSGVSHRLMDDWPQNTAQETLKVNQTIHSSAFEKVSPAFSSCSEAYWDSRLNVRLRLPGHGVCHSFFRERFEYAV